MERPPRLVMLDTSFLIRLRDAADPLHGAADTAFRAIGEAGAGTVVSAVAEAEFYVRNPRRFIDGIGSDRLDFASRHAPAAGELARIVYDIRARRGGVDVRPRTVIPNDTKMFAQADAEPAVACFVSADSEARKVYDLINAARPLSFAFVDIRGDWAADLRRALT